MNNYLELVSNTLINLTYTKDLELLNPQFCRVREKGCTIYFIGNGGSAAIASHAVADFEKNAGIRAVSLSDNAEILTAYANDHEAGMAFANRLDVLLKPEDLVVIISSSATSPNLVQAAKVACRKGNYIIGLLGNSGGVLGKYCDAEFLIYHTDMQVTEDINSIFMHMLYRKALESGTRLFINYDSS